MKKLTCCSNSKIPPKKSITSFYSILYLLFMALTISSCQKTNVDIFDASAQDGSELTQKDRCGSMALLNLQMKQDPSLQLRMEEIENFTDQFIKNNPGQKLSGDTVIIPIVVNVLYSTAAENIADAQIISQIDVLNEDYAGVNKDITSVPAIFQPVKANDIKIRFVLDRIIRKATTVTSWTTNNYIKKSVNGGLDPTNPTTSLNIWIGTLSSGLLGYAQFPGGSSLTDGVVILNKAFGSKLKYSTGYYLTNFDRGRTATHEIGHWMNLKHIWGSTTCGDDLVADTPQANASNSGCPVYPHYSTCTGKPVEMTMNYMDYTNDACMNMFTAGQKQRMQAIFAVGGARASFR